MRTYLVPQIACDRCCVEHPTTSRATLKWPRNEPLTDAEIAKAFQHNRRRAIEDDWEEDGDDLICVACAEKARRSRCSECNIEDEGWWSFCPNCGHEMPEEET